MLKEVIIFSAGAAIGAASVYFLLKKKFEERAHTEIDAIREYYAGTVNVVKPEKLESQKEAAPKSSVSGLPPMSAYKEALKKSKYVSYDKISSKADDSPQDDDPGDIYVIPEDKHISDEDYDTQSLVWYEGDNVLTRPDDSIVDTHEYVGMSMLNSVFNTPEKEVVFVRNEKHMVDYEVIRDPRCFKTDILGEEDD